MDGFENIGTGGGGRGLTTACFCGHKGDNNFIEALAECASARKTAFQHARTQPLSGLLELFHARNIVDPNRINPNQFK
jgi:hypothetical protein